MRGKRDCERLENSVGSSAVHTRKLPNNLKTRPDQQTNEYVENGRVVSGRSGGSGRGSGNGVVNRGKCTTSVAGNNLVPDL